MKKIAFIICALFVSAAHADLNVPNATVKPSPAAPAAGAPGAVPPGLPVPPPVPGVSNLPGNGMPPLGAGIGGQSSGKSIDDQLKGLYVAAVLGDVAILRVGATPGVAGAGGMGAGMPGAAPMAAGAVPGMAGGAAQPAVRRPAYMVKDGVPFKLDDTEMIPTVNDRQVTLSAGKKGRVVFVGMVDALPLPTMPARISDVAADSNFVRQRNNVDAGGSTGGTTVSSNSGSSDLQKN